MVITYFLGEFFAIFGSYSSDIETSQRKFILPMGGLRCGEGAVSCPLKMSSFSVVSVKVILPSARVTIADSSSLLIYLVLWGVSVISGESGLSTKGFLLSGSAL